MEELLLSILNKMFLHCGILYSDSTRLNDLLDRYLVAPNEIKRVNNTLICKYDKMNITFELDNENYINLIRLECFQSNKSGD